ncbi:MFS general substrate transporter [Rhizopogon vinicolor AM-OR11-026]|uniref:MFS general substrate transporter n=1 Tax=Rhizopogon vinicolor AM-OR11-026 TaxID=1314800 RepID=A0A1B7MSN2_9AGAM|nr:MFS general substrate transporter [Rhizopogon vinicolor AM-OR11-026]
MPNISVEVGVSKEVDLIAYYEEAAGRLVVDPEYAKIQFGDVMASRLKLSADGSKVLWPQPADDPNDPQNWTNFHKNMHLIILTMSSMVPDFDSGIGIAAIFGLAQTYDTTTGVINDLTSNWSIFLFGWGGLFWVMLARRYGRLPVLFWSQLFALAFLVGDTFATNLATFAGMRCLTAFFGICPQVIGLYVVTDIFPFHLQARKLNIWTSGFLISPFISPFAFGFLVAHMSWRWAYGIGCMYGVLVLLLIAFFMDETMYERHLSTSMPSRTSTGLRYRFETLIGITGYKMAKYRPRWSEVVWASLDVVWRPQFFFIVLFETFVFGFLIGVNTTNVVFLGTPPPVGFGFSQYAVAASYATPIIAIFIGELIGRYMNDFIMNLSIRKNNGFFVAESRLWTCYVAMPLYICGFLMLGAGIQYLNKPALFLGWGIAIVALALNTVAVYAYCNDCFPNKAGEVCALINFAISMGGFAVAYFQVPWATKFGALVVFGVEAAHVPFLITLYCPNNLCRLVIGMFLATVPMTQLKGSYFRASGILFIPLTSLNLSTG